MFKKILGFVLAMMLVGNLSVLAAGTVTIQGLAYSNEDYLFRIKGSDQEFILLDEGDTSDSRFFVMAKGYYGKYSFHSGKGYRFDPNEAQSMAYFLNNDFLKFGNQSTFTLKYYKLPQEIIDHIDMDHVWDCEAGVPGTTSEKPYQIKCGVAIPSQTELLKYSDKIGWNDDYVSTKNDVNVVPWALRTVHTRGEIMAIRPGISMKEVSSYGSTTNGIGIRPVFWLSTDFFRNVELDLSTLGSGVAEVFKKYYTIDELTDMYSEQECYDYFGYKTPIKLSVSENNTLSIKNNSVENHYAILMNIYYDEGGCPKRFSYMPIYVNANNEIFIENNVDSDAAYVKAKVVKRGMPYTVISNSVDITGIE